ncbi:hypothetical protein BSIN_0524 [Burkholderia singularis]|uniref:Uncharacterized protein n=1 Tax=Burkholderia singularis TaxID=1503053 RepID=A0A238H7R7_9BURK|nr:hypothetical protein BSIN_0524 [Burkholderia singularis]
MAQSESIGPLEPIDGIDPDAFIIHVEDTGSSSLQTAI